MTKDNIVNDLTVAKGDIEVLKLRMRQLEENRIKDELNRLVKQRRMFIAAVIATACVALIAVAIAGALSGERNAEATKYNLGCVTVSRAPMQECVINGGKK